MRSLLTALTLRLCPLALAIAFTLTLTLALPARAHDPFEAFHTATLHPDRLDLTVTMAQATALRLIDPAAKIAALTPANLPTHRAALLREAATLFTITSVSSEKTKPPAPLPAQKTEIELTEENDLIFRVTYPRPPPGPLRFLAAYLKKLGDGYGGILEINDQADHNLGWEQLLWAHPAFEVIVPP